MDKIKEKFAQAFFLFTLMEWASFTTSQDKTQKLLSEAVEILLHCHCESDMNFDHSLIPI